jgi:hypothetical protein
MSYAGSLGFRQRLGSRGCQRPHSVHANAAAAQNIAVSGPGKKGAIADLREDKVTRMALLFEEPPPPRRIKNHRTRSIT